MICIPREGRVALSWSLFQSDYLSSAAQQWEIHLYTSAVPLNLGTTRAELLLAEAAWGDYLPQPLRLPADVGETSAGNELTVFAEALWTAGAGGLPVAVYGYWIDVLTYRLTRSLAWVESLPVTVMMEDEGDIIAIAPQFALGQLQPDSVIATAIGGGLLLGGDLGP
jgi:hypothetical protein